MSFLGVVEKSSLSPGWFLYRFNMAGKACCDERQKTKHYGVSSYCLAAIEPILPLMINVGPQFPRMVNVALWVIATARRCQGRKTKFSQSFLRNNPLSTQGDPKIRTSFEGRI